MSSNNRDQGQFCRDCGGRLSRGHSQVCTGNKSRQVRSPAQNSIGGNRSAVDEEVNTLRSLLGTLTRRVAMLENVPTRSNDPMDVSDLRVPHPGQPTGSTNRVFSFFLADVSGAATPLARIGNAITVNSNMTGFSAWAQGLAVVSISRVVVQYVPTAVGYTGSASVHVGFDRTSSPDRSPGAIATATDSFQVSGTGVGFQVRVTYGDRTPYERYLVGAPASRNARSYGRIHLGRAVGVLQNPAAQTFNQTLGHVYVHVQCAVRSEQI